MKTFVLTFNNEYIIMNIIWLKYYGRWLKYYFINFS